MTRLILFIILFVILYAILRILIQGTPLWRKKSSQKMEPEELVQDPYCQTYIPKRSAVRKRIFGKDYYFCTQECFENFIKKSE